MIRLMTLYAAMMVGLFLGAGIIWWRSDDCGKRSAIVGKCLLWVDANGISIVPVPPPTPIEEKKP